MMPQFNYSYVIFIDFHIFSAWQNFMKSYYAASLIFITAKINSCYKTSAECRKSSSQGENLQLCQRKTLFQLNDKQKMFILIIYLVPNSYQKGSEAAYTNMCNGIIKNNNNNTTHRNPSPM